MEFPPGALAVVFVVFGFVFVIILASQKIAQPGRMLFQGFPKERIRDLGRSKGP